MANITISADRLTGKEIATTGLSLVGAGAGIYIGIKRKSGTWGTIGWMLLLTTAGYLSGKVITSLVKSN